MKGAIKNFVLWTIIGAVCMVNNYGCSGSFKYAHYSSKIPGLHVSLDYISGWTVRETRGEKGSYSHVIFIENSAGDQMKAFMSVTATPADDAQSSDIQAAAENLVKKRSLFKAFRVLSRSPGSLAGLETQELLLTYQSLNKLYRTDASFIPVKERIILCKKGNRMYSFNYQNSERAFDAFNPAFSHMLTTVEFTGE